MELLGSTQTFSGQVGPDEGNSHAVASFYCNPCHHSGAEVFFLGPAWGIFMPELPSPCMHWDKNHQLWLVIWTWTCDSEPKSWILASSPLSIKTAFPPTLSCFYPWTTMPASTFHSLNHPGFLRATIQINVLRKKNTNWETADATALKKSQQTKHTKTPKRPAQLTAGSEI